MTPALQALQLIYMVGSELHSSLKAALLEHSRVLCQSSQFSKYSRSEGCVVRGMVSGCGMEERIGRWFSGSSTNPLGLKTSQTSCCPVGCVNFTCGSRSVSLIGIQKTVGFSADQQVLGTRERLHSRWSLPYFRLLLVFQQTLPACLLWSSK